MSHRTFGFAVFASLVCSGALVVGQDQTWGVLRYPDAATGVLRTWCYDVNQRGDMVGGRQAPSVPSRAFLLSEGLYYDLHPQGATQSAAWGINSQGDIVGDYWIGSQEHGFLIRNGEFSTVDFAGKAMAHLRGINSRGDIVGAYMTTATSQPQGFLLENDGTFVEVQYPGSMISWVMGISEQGNMAGRYMDAEHAIRGFLRTADGAFISLDYPGAFETSAESINTRGEVIGYYWDTQSPRVSHGFRWKDGNFYQEDYPQAAQTMIHGLNNRGDTCGMMTVPTTGGLVWGGFSSTRGARE